MQNQINGMEVRIDKLEKAVQRIEIWVIIGAVISIAMRCLPAPQVSAPPAPAPQSSGNSHVQIATSPESLSEIESRREYYTVDEVARKEGKSARTVISDIESGKIDPPPAKIGRAWAISREYRYLPLVTDNGGS